ncbi:MAG: cytidine deaminase [Ruminococcaceae bacterium]|nr:cytidine deaminase [Oscillospiraceae bacterium]
MDDKMLIEAAREARKNAYAPYSKFHVGAAILTDSGKIYTGCNFENASFGAGTCAERTALGAAITAGERNFIAIACVGKDASITPCGICRQALAEFGNMRVICAGESGEEMRIYKLSDLLPHSFSL